MDKWQILGIDPTTDLKQIKKAYEVKLDQLDVDLDSQAFEILKGALDTVLLELDSNQESVMSVSKIDLTGGSLDGEITDKEQWEDISEKSVNISKPSEANFSEIFQDFVAQLTYFDDLTGWQKLLQTVSQLTPENHENARQQIAAFLAKNNQILSKNVQELLIDYFQFFGEDALFDEGFIKYLNRYPAFDFSMATAIQPSQRVEYFRIRHQLYELVRSAKAPLSMFPQVLTSARNIFAEDVSVDLIEIWYLLRKDFRLIDPFKSRRLQELMMKQPAGKQREILQDYLLAVKGYQPYKSDFSLLRGFLAKYPPVPQQVPVSVYRLMGGYLHFLMKDSRQVQYFWGGYEEQYGQGYFNPSEQHFLLQSSQRKATRKSTFIWVGVTAGLSLLLMIVIIGTIGSFRSDSMQNQITSTTDELPNTGDQIQDAPQDPVIAEKYQTSDELGKRFFFYFYLDQKHPDKEAFIDQEMAGIAQEQARTLADNQIAPQVVTSQINLIILAEKIDQETLYYLQNFSLQAMLNKAPDSILLVRDGKIQEIFGTEWGTDPITFAEMADEIRTVNEEGAGVSNETELPPEEQL